MKENSFNFIPSLEDISYLNKEVIPNHEMKLIQSRKDFDSYKSFDRLISQNNSVRQIH